MTGRTHIRAAGWAIAAALIALPIIGALQGWFGAGRWRIDYLQVEAERVHVSDQQIKAAVQPHLGKGFFGTDLGEVQQALVALPWVQSAEARKRWPDTLVLRVYEQRPFAHWNGTRLVSRTEQIFAVPGAATVADLPQLSGPDSRMREVVKFYEQARQAFAGTGLRITGAHLSGRDSWSLDLGDGARIEVGRDQPGPRLRRFLGVYRRLMANSGQRFESVDLRYPNGFAMRWAASSAVTAPATGGVPST